MTSLLQHKLVMIITACLKHLEYLAELICISLASRPPLIYPFDCDFCVAMNDDNENLLWDSCPTFRDPRIFQQCASPQRQVCTFRYVSEVCTSGHVEVTETAVFCVACVSLSWIGHEVTLPSEHWRNGSFGPKSTYRQSQLVRM